MTVEVLNPDSAVLQQVDEHWQKIATLLVWKLAPKGVTLTLKDLQAYPADRVLLTHGHRDSLEFKLVSREEAERLAAHDRATNQGRA